MFALSRTPDFMMNEKLNRYREKRSFRLSPEPSGTTGTGAADALFVVQRHDAHRHHYDFRLQVNGVLKSWAVPKGPSTDPDEKRLAIATEDHPLDYASFEGVIPEGEYGGGRVIVWDTGTYLNRTEKSGKAVSLEDAIAHGHLRIWLEGRKLRGGYTLNRFKRGRQDQWLLVKMRDEEANPDSEPVDNRPESVLSGSRVEEIGIDHARLDRTVSLAEELTGNNQAGREPVPSHVEPMLAYLAKVSPQNVEQYAFEYKWDGIRAICFWNGKRIKIESRNKLNITHQWPELTKLGESLGPTAVVLDGEIVALDSNNRVNFSLLSQRMHVSSKPTATQMRSVPIVYMIFDILYLKDRSLMKLAYEDRRSILSELNLSADAWQTPAALFQEPEVILEAALENGMEGLVAKRLDSTYRPGHRSRNWLKIKVIHAQEFVIGGWIPFRGSEERGVGSLLLGYYNNDGQLVFAGKVGTGFTDALRKDLKKRFSNIMRETSPFATEAPSRRVFFIEPEMVAEIEFREWTADGKLRHPSFKGLRMDKDPLEVVRETSR